ncbi:hypothetical protein CSB37_03035 [bacterium DOLZORAL124_38_8]|nr:MAG: hypothetical protein CSB37_03035 [bacterium DOLZORAL124_38_8]
MICIVSDTSFAIGEGILSKDSILSFAKGDETLQSFARFFAEIIKLATFLATWILSIVGDLIDTKFVTGPEATNVLLPMWRYVRDLTNIGFVLVLVWLSFANLYSSFSDGGNWKIKDKLPRIIIAIVAVNFSSLFLRVAIDAVNFGSIALFSIADSQLEANHATSVHRILTKKTWSLAQRPKNINKTFSSKKIFDKYGMVTDKEKDKNGKEIPVPEKQNIPRYVPIPKVTAVIGEPCTIPTTEKHYVGQTFYTEDFVNRNEHKNSIAVCGSFSQSMNALFCSEEGLTSDSCFFQINPKRYQEKTGKNPKSTTAQNLFMAFGTQFIKLERLPILAANATSLYGVLDSTLFALILSVAYVIALIAFFVALVARIFVLWGAIICSPAIVGASIVGDITDKTKDAIDLFVTHLILPLKVALAFSVTFVMINGMITFKPQNLNTGFIDFGPQLSHLAMDQYSLVWQVATVFAFWTIAKWATEGTISHRITDTIFDWSEKIAEYLAKSATIEQQFIAVPNQNGAKVGIADVFAAPLRAIDQVRSNRAQNRQKLVDALVGENPRGEYDTVLKAFQANSVNKNIDGRAKNLKENLGKLSKDSLDTKHELKKFFKDFVGNGNDDPKVIKEVINKVKSSDQKFGKALFDAYNSGNYTLNKLDEFTKEGKKKDSGASGNEESGKSSTTTNNFIQISNQKVDLEGKNTQESKELVGDAILSIDDNTISKSEINTYTKNFNSAMKNKDKDFKEISSVELIKSGYTNNEGKLINNEYKLSNAAKILKTMDTNETKEELNKVNKKIEELGKK